MTIEINPADRTIGVVVMAKEPSPGKVKTRLLATLSPVEAATFYAAMLRDRCAWLESLPGITRAVAIADFDGDGPVPSVVPEGFVAVPQPAGDLGVGLDAAARYFLDRGMPVVLVDSDSPTLPLSHLEETLALLRDGATDVVVGPSDDGGYCLLGLGRECPELFIDMPWSTAEVVPRTLQRAARAGLRTHVLPTWWDVDDGADLDRLERALFASSWPAHSAEWLRRRRLAALAIDEGARIPEIDRWRATWHRLGSRKVYATPWLSIREDLVRLPDGRASTYSVVDTGECVGVLPFTDPDHVLLVRQYRYVAQRVTWEMPTGGVGLGESAEQAARRELAEEAKVEVQSLRHVGTYHTSKSCMDETAHLFVSHGTRVVNATPDDTEYIRIEKVEFDCALAMVESGEITDSMTIIAVLRAARDPSLRG